MNIEIKTNHAFFKTSGDDLCIADYQENTLIEIKIRMNQKNMKKLENLLEDMKKMWYDRRI